MDIPIIGQRTAPQKTIEVCRSFARKINLATYGGPQYESADFFASRKLECNEDESAWVSQQLFEECIAEVAESVNAYVAAMKSKIAARSERRTA